MEFRRRRNEDDDRPTYSRLFVVCEKRLTEDQIKDAFSEYGEILEVRMPRDHNTGDFKGIAYIQFAKTSEAAAALEAMNKTVIAESTRPLKVMVAANRSDIPTEHEDDEKYKRLFISIAKSQTEDMLEDHFGQFGRIDSIVIQRDRDSGEPKGGAYIKYKRFSEASAAFEQCDRKYRAIFAMPKGYNKRRAETSFESNINNLAANVNTRSSLITMMKTRPQGYTNVMFMCSPYLTHSHVDKIFDLIPGLTNCQYYVDLIRNIGKGMASYSNPVSAAYAVEKLNKFEYPPGSKIFVKPDDNSRFSAQDQNYSNIPTALNGLRNAIASASNSATPDLAQLSEAIAQASKLIKQATTGVTDDEIPDGNDLNYCSVSLPSPKPLADIDSTVAKRCFLVCKPQPPPLTVLRDIFCRFGDLINVYTLPNKTVGYARYASASAADEAMKVLHGAEVCGIRMKVLEAEDEAPNKRVKYHHDN